ncbi:MAG: MBL fold metallo-hydrolase [Alphaproteobacteria bacterium]|nr:MAG: MBL fold metallo-hydrolase [Alphaproteobacteria bacterium]
MASLANVSRLLFAALALALPGARALAAEPAPSPADPERRCPGLIAGLPDVRFVNFERVALGEGEVRLTYVGHSTFLIESPRLVRIATDYNDYVKPPVLPDIVTMNHAHTTHYTDAPDPAIKFVLRGWNDDGSQATHDLSFQDVRVRNVPTNIRDWAGGTERYGNSIFVFEVAQLCIAHLGHLHHTLTKQQLDDIGRLDVVLAPVDGTYTLDLDGMMEVLHALKAPLMIPMHYFSAFTLERFLDRVRQSWEVEVNETPSIVLSRAKLPKDPKVLVLPGH